MSLFVGGGRKNPLPAPPPMELDEPGPNRLLFGPVHHAMVGVPCRYYWQGGIADAASYAGVTFSHVGPGTATADLWSWTPSSGDVGDHQLELSDSAGGHITQTVRVHPASGSGSIRLLTLGDSITAWNGSDTPWILRLRDSLNAAGITTEFDGPRQQDTNPISGLYHNAEGGRSYASGELVSPSPATAVAAWVSTYGQPTHAVCAVGTNDVTNVSIAAMTMSQAMGYARAMVNALLTQTTAKVAIMLPYAFMPGAYAYSYTEVRRAYQEAQLIEFASEIASGDVHLLNVHACTSTGDYADGLHPNGSTGHAKIHDQVYPWYRGVATGAI